MTSTTDPTVPLPTATDIDDDDDDDSDDNVSSSLSFSQPPAATSPPAQPTSVSAPIPSPVTTHIPGVPVSPASTTAPAAPSNPSPSTNSLSFARVSQSSATGLADTLPSGSPTALSPTDPTNQDSSSSDRLGPGASAGIGIGVSLVVCLAAFVIWLFLRRRKSRQKKTRSTSNHSSDEEHLPPTQKMESEVYAYRSNGPAEVSGVEKPRRWSELESPTYVSEVGDAQVFRAELPGSAVPVSATGKQDGERLFADAPIDEVDELADVREGTVDKMHDKGSLSDPPIRNGDNTLGVEPTSMPVQEKM